MLAAGQRACAAPFGAAAARASRPAAAPVAAPAAAARPRRAPRPQARLTTHAATHEAAGAFHRASRQLPHNTRRVEERTCGGLPSLR
jgi:hypothetical protein